jgi:hypothetical protein
MKIIVGKDGVITVIGSFDVSVDKVKIPFVSYVDTGEGFVRMAVPVNKKDQVESIIRKIDPFSTNRYEPKESIQVIEFFSKNIKIEIN